MHHVSSNSRSFLCIRLFALVDPPHNFPHSADDPEVLPLENHHDVNPSILSCLFNDHFLRTECTVLFQSHLQSHFGQKSDQAQLPQPMASGKACNSPESSVTSFIKKCTRRLSCPPQSKMKQVLQGTRALEITESQLFDWWGHTLTVSRRMFSATWYWSMIRR